MYAREWWSTGGKYLNHAISTHARFPLREDIFSATAEIKDGLQHGSTWHMKRLLTEGGSAAGEPLDQTYSSGKWYELASFSTISDRSILGQNGNQTAAAAAAAAEQPKRQIWDPDAQRFRLQINES